MAGRSRTVAEIAASLAARRAAEDARRAEGIAARRRARQRTAAREAADERRRALNSLTVLVAAGLARLAQLGGPGAAQRAIDLACVGESESNNSGGV